MGATSSHPALVSGRADVTHSVVDSLLELAGLGKTKSKASALKAILTPESEHVLHDIIKHNSPEILEVVLDTVKSRLQAEGGNEFAQAKMKRLLDDSGARGRTPLWIACYCNNEEAVAICAREGANPWLADKLAKKTPLMMACVMGHAGCVKSLLDNMHEQFWVSPEDGFTRYIDARSVTGFPALTYAVAWNHTRVVEVLLQYAPSLTIQNPTQSFESALVVPPGSTPLHVAAITSNLDIAMMLLRSYAERSNRMPDIRLLRNVNGHQPWQLARNMLGSTSVLDASQILHPTIPLESFFPPGTITPQGVPSLSCLAANALRVYLMGTIETAAALGRASRSGTPAGGSPAGGSPNASFHGAHNAPPGIIAKAAPLQSAQLQQGLSRTQSDGGASIAGVASTSGVSPDGGKSREEQRAARAAQREEARKQRDEQRQRWLRRYQLHQALMHANSSSMENLQVLDNNQPAYPVSWARSSDIGGSLWGGSSPVQGASCGSSPRWQGLRDGGGAVPSMNLDDLPPGTLGLNPARPTIGEEGEEEVNLVQDVGSPPLPGAFSRGQRSSNATGTSGDSGPNSVAQIGLTTSASCDVGDVLEMRQSMGDLPAALQPSQSQRSRGRLPSESGSVTLRGMPSMERRRGGPSSVVLPGGGGGPAGCVSMSYGRSSAVSGGPSASQSLIGGSPEGASPNQRSSPSGGEMPPSEANEMLCGICFDHNCLLRIAGCKHAMCDECAQQLLGTMVNAPLPCPFCRDPISGFECKPP